MSKTSDQINSSSYQILHTIDPHVEGLTQVYLSWDNNPFIKIDGEPSIYFKMCINEGDLPPIKHASKDNYQLYTVMLNEQIIGYFDMYKGYPNQDSLWISVFVIDSHLAYQGHGIQVFEIIEKHLIDRKYKTLSLGVKLQNVSALKFWTKLGFNQILGIYGDGDDFTIGLKKQINAHM